MLRIDGQKTWLVPFSGEHMNDPRYYGWLTDYDVVKTINRPEYLTRIPFDAVKHYCEAAMASVNDLFLAIHWRDGGQFVGTLKVGAINDHAGTADIGILVGDRSMWGKGVATDAIRAVGGHLFDVRNLRKLTAGVMAVNPAMMKVFLNLGFRLEGALRQQNRFESGYCDHHYLGCFRNEFRFADAARRTELK